jgi:hypothetical protein
VLGKVDAVAGGDEAEGSDDCVVDVVGVVVGVI